MWSSLPLSPSSQGVSVIVHLVLFVMQRCVAALGSPTSFPDRVSRISFLFVSWSMLRLGAVPRPSMALWLNLHKQSRVARHGGPKRISADAAKMEQSFIYKSVVRWAGGNLLTHRV